MDTAMRLGLNWPLGPFGFAERLGTERALELLRALERDKGPAYAPAPLLRRAAESGTQLRDISRE
jgi:3-hydroxybutyryl-CoA dehydrogenase